MVGCRASTLDRVRQPVGRPKKEKERKTRRRQKERKERLEREKKSNPHPVPAPLPIIHARRDAGSFRASIVALAA